MTFSDRRVGAVLNALAVPVSLDYDEKVDEGERYEVGVIPAGVFVNPETDRVLARTGFSDDPEAFSAEVRAVVERYAKARETIAALDPNADLEPADRLALGRALEATAAPPADIRAAYAAVVEAAPATDLAHQARFRQAGLSFALGEVARADEELTSLLADLDAAEEKTVERVPETLYALAQVRIKGRKIEEGLALLDRLVEDHPDDPRAVAVVRKKIRERFR